MTSRWREGAEADPEAGGEESDRDRRERYTKTERHSDGQTDRQTGREHATEAGRDRETKTDGDSGSTEAETGRKVS